MDTEHNDVFALVQASEEMPMMKCTSGFFAQFGGPSLRHEMSLTHWLPRTDRDDGVGELQSIVGTVLHTDQECTRTRDVVLQPPHLRGQVFMTLSISMQPQATRAVANAMGAGADDDMDIASESMPAVPIESGSSSSSSSSSGVAPETSILKLTCTNIRFHHRIQAAGNRMSRKVRPATDRPRASTIGRIQFL